MNKNLTTNCTSFFEIPSNDEIKKKCIIKNFQKGDYIVVQGDEFKHLPIVLEGVVRLDCSTNTKDFLLDYLIAGDACASSFSHINTEQKSVFSAQALTLVSIALIPIEEIQKLLTTSPEFVKYLLSQTSKNLFYTIELLKDLQSKNLEDRILKYLKLYKEKLSKNGFQLTHQQIATDLGASRESVTRSLSKLKEVNL